MKTPVSLFLVRSAATLVGAVVPHLLAAQGAAVSAHDAAEVTVLKMVLEHTGQFRGVPVSAAVSQGHGFCASEPMASRPACSSVKEEPFHSLYIALAKPGGKADSLPGVVQRLLGVQIYHQDTTVKKDCQTPRVIMVSRVAFDTSMTHAAASYTYVSGIGPMPGCGFMTGTTMLFTKSADGTWKLTAELELWMT